MGSEVLPIRNAVFSGSHVRSNPFEDKTLQYVYIVKQLEAFEISGETNNPTTGVRGLRETLLLVFRPDGGLA